MIDMIEFNDDNEIDIDDKAIAQLPELLYLDEANALYGLPVEGEAENKALEREMADLTDKMLLEVGAMFEDDFIELDMTADSLDDLDRLVSQVWGEMPWTIPTRWTPSWPIGAPTWASPS